MGRNVTTKWNKIVAMMRLRHRAGASYIKNATLNGWKIPNFMLGLKELHTNYGIDFFLIFFDDSCSAFLKENIVSPDSNDVLKLISVFIIRYQ